MNKTTDQPNTNPDKTPGVPRHAMLLAERFREGDTNAFKTIYMQWYDPVFFLLKRISRNELDAEDLAQDVFSTLWMQHATIDPSKDIRGYIFTLARRAAFKHIRRNKVRNEFLSSIEVNSDGSDDLREKILAKEMELLTDLIVSKMPAQRREAYLLSLKDGLDPAEIAERLDISPKSARDHIYQARKEIKEVLSFAILFWMSLI